MYFYIYVQTLTFFNTFNDRKRALVQQRIQQYFTQLTEGCGNGDCSNDKCASSPSFTFTNIGRDKLALEAITLFKSKALLCDNSPARKQSRVSGEHGDDVEQGPSTSTAPSASSSGKHHQDVGTKNKESQRTSVSNFNTPSSSSNNGKFHFNLNVNKTTRYSF